VVDLNSDFKTGFNENVMYTAASVNKVAILAALYDLYRKGAVDPAQILTLQKDDIQDYGTGSIRYDPPGTTYSVKTLSMLMMRKSDNTAAYLLANYVITVPLIQEMLGQWGLTQTDMVNNLTTSADMAILFQKIYQGQIAGDSYTKEMLNLMQESDFEDRLPARLPKGTAVYHKIGSETGFIHDVGIVNSGKNQWYIGVFTRDITDEPAAKDKIAEISKKVYDYMN
jgi:beta-lactamase class A